MIPRKPPRIPFPKLSIKMVEEKVASGEISPENSEKTINHLKSRYFSQNRLKEGEADPKLAGAILELAQGSDPLRTMLILGRGAVRVPKETVGLHLDFAKAQYGGHMGARSVSMQQNINCRKFALLNLPRMKFYNPHLDIKVFRRPWAGRLVQKTYPCTATILKCIFWRLGWS